MTTTLTVLIQRMASDSPPGREELFAAAYPELRKLARARLLGGGRNTVLDTTALVHESYLRFLSADQLRLEDRRAFFAYASRVMRSVIVDTVRERQAERRGGGMAELTLNTLLQDNLPAGESEILRINDALLALEEVEPRLARVVEMRYFGGYSDAEIAEALDLNKRTIGRDWEKARLLLLAMLKS
ncbi:ECF-type sigma factor [Ideonella sp. DXS29W]|uniref:ECF-type sigma factor n=1 Tax=Ideonella lacteola TaxID=2984193 RepID=A0ABU9C0D4_9BURK